MKPQTQSIMPKIALAAVGLCMFVIGYIAQPYAPAHAQLGSAISCNLSFGSFGGNNSVPTLDDNSDTQKNIGCTWKGIAWQIAHTVLHSLSSSVVNWINSGFNGSPSFLTNPEGFFMNVGDQVTGDLIGDAGPLAQSLCTPFALNIRLGLAVGQAGYDDGYNNQYKCTLSGVIAAQKHASASIGVSQTANGLTLGDILNGNVASTTYLANNGDVLGVNGASISQTNADTKDCLNGNFNKCGGWSGFGSIATGLQNSAGSAYIMAYDASRQQQAAKSTAVNNDLNRGGGFLSWQSCDNVAYQGPTQSGAAINQTKKVCTTQTPGSYINSSLAKATGASADELNMTNDLNQVVSALFSQLLSKTLSGGLFSSTQSSPSYPGMGSYINQLSNDPSLQQNVTNLSNQQAGIVGTYAQPAYQYISTENQALVALTAELTKYQQVRTCLFTRNSNATSSDTTALDNIMNTQIIPAMNTTQASITNASSTIQQISAIAAQIQSSQSIDQLSNTSSQYSARLSSLSASVDPNAAKLDLANVNNEIKSWDTTLKTYQNICQGGYYGN